MNQTQTKPSLTPPIFPLLLVNFIGTLGYSLIIPFLVFLVTRFGGNAFIYGIVGSTYPLFQLIGAPILGKWSDQFGRKRILLLSQLGTFFSWVIFLIALLIPISTIFEIKTSFLGGFTLTLPLLILFIARALDGLTGGNVSVANAYLADISDESNRKTNFGKLGVSGNLGFIFGPVIAGILGGTVLGEILPISVALIIAFVGVIIIMIYLPESQCSKISKAPDANSVRRIFGQENKDCYEIEQPESITLKKLLNIPEVPFLLSLYFLIFLGFNIFYTAFPIQAATQLKWTVTELGIFFSFLSGMLILVQGPVLTYLSKRFSDEFLTVVGNGILGINFILLTFEQTFFVYMAALFFALGNGLMWPSFLSILSKSANSKFQGYLQGVATSLGSLAGILGLIGGGIVYGILGKNTFICAAVIIFIVFLLCFRLFRHSQTTQ